MDSHTDGLPTLPCEECPKILLALLSSEAEFDYPGFSFSLGTVDTYFYGSCPLHTYLLPLILNITSAFLPILPGNTQISVTSVGPGSICIKLGIDGVPAALKPPTSLLFDLISDENNTWPSRVLTEWIDLELVHEWRDTCISQHYQCRKNAFLSTTADVMPHLLIDTYDMCLVKSKPGDRYAALSYVWGKSSALKTLINTFDQYQRHGIFQREEIAQQIPATVRDAISLTKLLRMRFLWVDALCIIQDDESSRTRELNAMAFIYATAELTIVAANGNDADYGLRGIQYSPNARPREMNQHVAKIPGGPSIAYRLDPVVMGKQEWNTRGWTFQESLFSTRQLIFIDNRIQWQCLCQYVDEQFDYKATYGATDELQRADAHFSRHWPNLMQYDQLMKLYQQRKFTNPEDIHSAFAGTAAAFSTTALGTFNFGLCESYFDAMMLWDFKWTVETPLRRMSSDLNKHVPSWTWMGWQSPVIMDACWDVYPVKRLRMHRMAIWAKLYPTVQWYSVSPSTGQRRKMTSHLEQYGHEDEIAKLPPPEGWTRRSNRDAHKTDIYSCALVHDVEFAYPIPIKHDYGCESDGQLSTPAETSHLLYCRTQRCYLFGGIPKGAVPRIRLTLCDEKGIEAGYLSRVPDRLEPEKCVGAKYELVAISRLAQGVKVLKEGKDYTKQDILWNVLWIEWVEGVAYRKGIGAVYEDAWEKLVVEEIDLMLG